MTLRQKQSRFAFLISKLIHYAYLNGYEFTFACAYHVPCKKCGEYEHSEVSFHKQRLAFDLNLFKDGKWLSKGTEPGWQLLGKYWESLDPKCSWGGHWNDANHFSFGEGK